MKILIVGVSGFIGKHLYDALAQDGHELTGCSRQEVPGINWQACDFNQSREAWASRLTNINIVINAVGIYQQTDKQRFSYVHNAGAKRLFDACAKNGIKVIQISAIGAELTHPVTDFLQSKCQADQYLLAQNLPHIVLYPGVVLGEGGRSTRQFSLLAQTLLIPIIFGKHKRLPLISIDQLTYCVIDLVNDWPAKKLSLVLIAKSESMEHLLQNLQKWTGRGKGWFIYIPEMIFSWVFSIFPNLSIGILNKQSLDMLSTYSSENYTPVTNETASESLLKRKASGHYKKGLHLQILFYFNIMALSVIWIVSGISSIISFEQSRELMVLLGIEGGPADLIIYFAVVGDILLGICLWLSWLRKYVIYTQIAVMVVYSLIISIFIPVYWLHPFAPVIKNLAMFVLALYLLIEEKE